MGKWVKTGFDSVVCDDTHSGTKVPAVEYMRSGVCSIIDQGQDFIAGYSDDMAAAYRNLPAIVFGDHTRVLKFVDFPFLLGADGAKILRPATDKLDCKFLFYYLLQHPVPSTGYNRHYSWMRRMQVEYPAPLDEQRHIAEILTTCDEVIEKSESVVDKYRAIKAGMLKDLFTRGIGKNGKLRPPPESAPQLYKDTALGKVPREWEIKAIGEMFAFKNGVSKGKEYFGHGVPIVNFTDVFNKPRITPDVLKGRVAMDRHEIDSFAVKSGDVFFTRTSETPEEIGMAAVVIGEFVDTVFSGFVLRGRPISEDLEDEFKVFCFRTDAIRKRIVGDCSYTTRALTNGTKLSAIKMGVPSKCEQQRIAERLSAIDAKIADELAVVAKYRKVKTGLMARLLTPPPDVEIVDGGVE